MIEALPPNDAISSNDDQLPHQKVIKWQWWILVGINIAFLIIGQAAATLLGRFYYDQGGNSKWMATLVQSVAFPMLIIPLFLFRSSSPASSLITISSTSKRHPIWLIISIYVLLGLLIVGDNWLYSTGLLYLPVSTYSLLCATQLASNAIFSYFINSQKFTALIFNSVVLLTLSASLLAVNEDSSRIAGVSNEKYIIGFISTLAASALYSLILSLMQFSFEKIIKKHTFSVVLEMTIFTSFIATCVCIIALFASGESKELKGEMDGFKKGKLAYVMTLAWTAVAWQICSVGVNGLIFVVSSLFSNVISTLSLAILPIAAVIVFHDKMNGVKVIAMLLAIWGFASYIYQNYLDDSKVTTQTTTITNNVYVNDVSTS